MPRKRWGGKTHSLRAASEALMDALAVSLSYTAMATPPSATSLGRMGRL